MSTIERIQQLIEQTEKPVSTIAKESGLKNSVISDLTAGRAKSPSADTLIKLARYFNVSADYLLCLTDEPKPLENHEVAEVATAALPAEFGLSLDLFKDSNFIETAKLYNGVSVELRSVVFGIVLGAMQTLKVDTKKILGY